MSNQDANSRTAESPTAESPTANSQTAESPVAPPATAIAQVDVRGPRFAAWITSAVLAIVLITGSWWLLALQAVVFALGAALGPRRSPYGLIFATLVAPRISPPTEREPTPPLRFAQGLGLAFAAVGVLGYVLGLPLLGAIATGFALIAALLNAAFGVCLGCQIYPLLGRLRQSKRPRTA